MVKVHSGIDTMVSVAGDTRRSRTRAAVRRLAGSRPLEGLQQLGPVIATKVARAGGLGPPSTGEEMARGSHPSSGRARLFGPSTDRIARPRRSQASSPPLKRPSAVLRRHLLLRLRERVLHGLDPAPLGLTLRLLDRAGHR